MKVKFLSNTSYQTFPITEDMIDIEENVLNQIGKTKQFKNGQIVDYVKIDNSTKILDLKQKLAKYKEDVEQVELFDMERSDYEQKKQMCANIILELRQLEKNVQ